MNSRTAHISIPILFIAILFGASALPMRVRAAELIVQGPAHDVGVGDEFAVSLVLDTQGESINALAGDIRYSTDILELREIRDGNSIINFWIEQPKDSSGTVHFSGITPGGFEGASGEVLTFVFQALQTGKPDFILSGAQALLNDGSGTATDMQLRATPFSVQATATGATVTPLSQDKTPPENFTISIAHDPSLFGGKMFAVFATQDKDSGIDHYEIAETPWYEAFLGIISWRVAESPALLQDQSGQSYIEVKAVDRAGNVTIAKLSPRNFSERTLAGEVLALLALLAVIVFLFRSRAQRMRRIRRRST